MTKEEAKSRLRKAGYTVSDDNSVVTVIISPDKAVKGVVKEVRDMLKSYGYEASFAVRQLRDATGHISDATDAAGTDEDAMDAVYTHDEETASADVPVGDADEDKDDKADKDDSTGVIDEKAGEDTGEAKDDIDYFDDDDSDMILTEDAVQFSLDDFGLDY